MIRLLTDITYIEYKNFCKNIISMEANGVEEMRIRIILLVEWTFIFILGFLILLGKSIRKK
jgi:hypothetical protein